MAKTNISGLQQAIQELMTARDEARAQMHLFSMEVRQRWSELEDKLLSLEHRAGLDTDKGEGAVARARELTHAVREFVQRNARRSSTPVSSLKSVMRIGPETCRQTDLLDRAAQIMWDSDCGAVPVIDEAEKLIGIVTDRDCLMATYTRGQPLSAITVATVMNTDLHTCSADDGIERVIDIMQKYKVRRVPIVDDDGRLLGIVSLADIARRYGEFEDSGITSRQVASLLWAVSEPRGEPTPSAGTSSATRAA